MHIYNLLGKDITSLVNRTEENSSKWIIDLSKLTKGIYFIKIDNESHTIHKN